MTRIAKEIITCPDPDCNNEFPIQYTASINITQGLSLLRLLNDEYSFECPACHKYVHLNTDILIIGCTKSVWISTASSLEIKKQTLQNAGIINEDGILVDDLESFIGKKLKEDGLKRANLHAPPPSVNLNPIKVASKENFEKLTIKEKKEQIQTEGAKLVEVRETLFNDIKYLFEQKDKNLTIKGQLDKYYEETYSHRKFE